MPCTRNPSLGLTVPGPFVNWAQNVTANPQIIYQPTSVDEIVAIVKEAEANNVPVRAVGSGWSFTDVMVTPGYMVYTNQLKRILSESMTGNAYPDDPVFGALTASARQRLLCHVEAGITIDDLHNKLEQDYQPARGGSPPPGVILNDGSGGSPQPHGYALKTLGGSGGQAIVGAVSTSVHGGDDHDGGGNPIQPLPDMVQGIHLVAAGGVEFFIQRGGNRAIVDASTLANLMPCVAGRIISNDDVFNAVVVSMGRMGIIYSVVLEVREQYVLLENRFPSTWNTVTTPNASPSLATLRATNRFLQILILPYANSDGDHTCFITTRNEVQPSGPPFGPSSGLDITTYACDQAGPAMSATMAGIVSGLAAAAGVLLAIPIVGPALAAGDIALITALTPLLDPSVTIDVYLATAVNILTQLGNIGLAESIVKFILSNAQSSETRQDLSYKIMDTYDYKSQCRDFLSLEVAFDADAPAYFGYIQALFGLIDQFASQNILVGAYISLRYCGGSNALLAIEQWPHTVCIEIAGLGSLANEMDVLSAFEQEAANRGGIVHWGQLNSRSRADIEGAFPVKIDKWRSTLARLSRHGKLSTFDNDFCGQHGLEVYDATKITQDLSYLIPLLLDSDSPEKELSCSSALLTDDWPHKDLSYLDPLFVGR